MVWFKVDDSFYDHPKVFDAPDCAVALWTRAGAWSARNLTDGFVPTGMPARLCDDPDTAVKELVRRGLWTRTAGGFKFHDWPEYQPSKDAVTDLRAKRAEAGRRGGQAKAAKQNASNGLANASHIGKQNAAPTRPDPSRPIGGVQVGEEGHPDAHAREEPPPKCPKHIDDPDPPNCGACKDARQRHETWQQQRAQDDALARSTAARQRAEAERAAIDNCHWCDDTGKRGAYPCNHTDPALVRQRATRGAALARERAPAVAAARQPRPPDPIDAALAELTPPESETS